MKLKKPVITIAIIFLLVINLIFFSFAIISKNIIKEDFLYSFVDKFDLKKYVLNDDAIKVNINNFKYPKEAFDYIDNTNVNIIKNKFMDNLLNNKEVIIDSNDIKYILNNSVYEYENRSGEETLKYVQNDIETISLKLSNSFSTDFINTFNLFKFFSKDIFQSLSIIISMILIIFIIFFEKTSGILISSIIGFIYSLTLYYLDSYFIKNMILDNKSVLYFKDIEELSISFDFVYIICFIFSFVLLLIYIVDLIKKLTRNIRLSSYGKNWR